MKNLHSITFLAVAGLALANFQPSSTSAVSLVGGVIKARHSIDQEAKYPRKDCPVCEGKGWYISGDGIEKVNCGYCEEEKPKDYRPELAEPEENDEEVVIDEPELVPVPKQFILRK